MKIRSNYPAKKCRLDGIQFARYSANPKVLMARHLDWWQIRRVHDIFARAENSGSEGYYVEIAKWHPKAKQWQKFAFQKFLGGEVWRDLGALETAVRVAAMVNLAPYGPSLIHHPGRTRTYVMDGKRFQWRKPVSVVDVRQFEFTSIVHAMPAWGTHKTAA